MSIVVPTYERAGVLPRALDSVLAQTYPEFELLVVDDGSTDETAEVVADYRARDDRIRYLAHDENQGLAAARNTGIEAATGEYVTFLDSDDEFHPDLLKASVRTLSDLPSEYGGTYVAYEVLGPGERERLLDVRPDVRSVDALDGYQVRMGGTTLRSSVFDDVGRFDPAITFVDDYEFWLRLLDEYALRGVDEPLYRYYKHGDQITESDADLLRGLGQLLDRKANLVPTDDRAKFRYKRGHAFARQGRMAEAAAEFDRARRLAPDRVMNHYYYAAANVGPVAFELPLRAASLTERVVSLTEQIEEAFAGPRTFAGSTVASGSDDEPDGRNDEQGGSEFLARGGDLAAANWERFARADSQMGFTRFWPDTDNRVLLYHSVGGGFYGEVSPARLRHDLRYLDEEYRIVGLPEAIDSRAGEKTVALTFDDGFRDFYDHVVPVLRELGVPATVFVVTESITDREFVHDEGANYEYMTAGQLRELADDELVTLGSHTRTHPDLGRIDDRERLVEEIRGAKADMEAEIGVTPTQFSYPYSGKSAESVALVRDAYRYAVDGVHRELPRRRWTDPHVFPRVDGAKSWPRVRWELRDLSTDVLGFEQWLRRRVTRGSTREISR
ncbi:glycosyltransferase [Halorussus litoreus]|uniref:glycosyltransferase n=1 Tax=Halorussus litoreus TaxID=1710536 RepID=UPI0018E594BA|nr:glycosyltransferase [Halorussus litoreus]